MKLLCIDTTKPEAVICLNNEGKASCIKIPDTKRHSEALLNEIENFLCENKLTVQNLTHLGCVTGPGSFTGIRIGMATVKALSFALNIPIVCGDYFTIVSGLVKNAYVALKNTSSSVYLTQISRSKCKQIEVVENSKILDTIGDKKLYLSPNEQIEDVKSYKELYNISIEEYQETMLNYFVKEVETGNFVKSSNFVPVYAQLSQAERNIKG